MTFPYKMTQATLTSKFVVVLHQREIEYIDQTILSSKRRLAYKDIRGIFRDAESIYIIAAGDEMKVMNKPTQKGFQYFLELLLTQVKKAHGYI